MFLTSTPYDVTDDFLPFEDHHLLYCQVHAQIPQFSELVAGYHSLGQRTSSAGAPS